MNALEIERMLDLIDAGTAMAREEVVRYISQNEAQILADLREKGEATIPTSGGKSLVLRATAVAA